MWCSPKPLMEEFPNLFRLTRNMEAKAVDYWITNEKGGTRGVDLCHKLNDWEIGDLINLLGTVYPIQLR